MDELDEASVARLYRLRDFQTASRLQSWQHMVTAAVHLMEPWDGDLPTRNRVQNMLVVLQQSLDLRGAPARQVHGLLARVWDLLETGEVETVRASAKPLRHLLGTIEMLRKGVPDEAPETPPTGGT